MTIAGNMIIGQDLVKGSKKAIYAVNPATGENLEPAYLGGSAQEVDRACALAEQAFDTYRETDLETRAKFLEQIAANLAANGPAIIERAGLESGLPKARLEGELGRTMNQLKLFAEEVRAGRWLGVKIDTAMPNRTPLPRSDIRLRHIPLGPVVVFGASNFPLAFSVAGGDTASALAAGCPVVVKGHSAHPGTSELVGQVIQAAVKSCGMPEGTFSLLFGSGADIGSALVADPRVKAVGFTGSRSGGVALMKIAAARSEPIPVYAEMSSINPVYLLPEALKNRADAIATGFVNSMLMGSGQFCTNPGLMIVKDAPELDAFISKVADLISVAQPGTMLTPGIHQAFESGVGKLKDNGNVQLLAQAQEVSGPNQCRARLFVTTAQAFLNDHALRDEVFGSNSLVIRCKTEEDIFAITNSLEGQLTATVLMDPSDNKAFIQKLMSILERKVGRILFNGYPTGVEVCHAMVHGGPFPATSDSRTTSVGTEAIWRFLRPVAYQDIPEDLLPSALKDDGWQVPKFINGK
ncbi:aldehyde dehydrogenase (NADP(+)) [Polynucleobacter sp. MWH-Aus1W21]|uniref:aldehyde dehydrogenase (NADP(+)) n=1 Tax=Polynucleobacter sp. MWH-Aus1W21 TaxID=1855880 RepID=UPI001BFECD1F|nr:aldehyde dehydrogenase (NADP(+)) [Polynucleobacter sp. MWH-Aus1W21]QWD65345.1 aldehyde dehydrogenase (NADP(+)) [Polynucleobacter sp. MWH-Aus1W21]